MILKPRQLKCQSETNKERQDRRQAAKLAMACNDKQKLHFVLSLVLSPFLPQCSNIHGRLMGTSR